MKTGRSGIALLSLFVGIGIVAWAAVPGDLVEMPNPFPVGLEPPEGTIFNYEFKSNDVSYIDFVIYDDGLYGVQSTTNVVDGIWLYQKILEGVGIQTYPFYFSTSWYSPNAFYQIKIF